ncbi:hypothetical protein SNE26_24195 [Mucilaginibacter sp. cycad4]|uniref:hypothetical protein n=1 Tax=Mucilaginibacter sp. cycad4 TaxID=3342096 RepID=UPI002AABCC75|nr:hypothetical protein [Mucilaginibacter gossypii]WPU99118.1 hypothetical protein SNE26_24195 [Mucilaginibacter gossypii]
MDSNQHILAIGPVPFIIDTLQEKLIQYDDHENTINFNDLTRHEGYYTARFHKGLRNLADGYQTSGKINDQIMDLTLPGIILAVPGELPDELKSSLSAISQKKGWGFYLGGEDLAKRLSGVLPYIDLAGTEFTIDWRLKELRETAQSGNIISLRNMEMSDDGHAYLTFYDTETHCILEADEFLFELPEHVVLLEIPNEIWLDPIAVARSYGMNDTDILITYPISKKLSAKVTPIAETGLSKFIAENVKRRDNRQDGLEPDPGLTR